MPRARSPQRDAAYQIWLDSDGEKKASDIAAEIGVTESLIRKWKSADRWQLPNKRAAPKKGTKKKGKRAPKKEAPKTPPKRGAPYGNKNAVGNEGGAPIGSKNHFKHGAFERIIYEKLTDEEKEVFEQDDYGDDVLKALKDELRLLNAKQVRLMRRMNEIQATAIQSGTGRQELFLTNVKKIKTTTLSGLYRDEDGKPVKIASTSFYDGNIVDSTETDTQNMFLAFMAIEKELDKVTARKTKILQQIEAIEIGRKRVQIEEKRVNSDSKENEMAKAWADAMAGIEDE